MKGFCGLRGGITVMRQIVTPAKSPQAKVLGSYQGLRMFRITRYSATAALLSLAVAGAPLAVRSDPPTHGEDPVTLESDAAPDGHPNDHPNGHRDEHGHAPLPEDESLDLAGAVDAALEAWPGTLELMAHRAQADAWSRRGQSWLSDRPSVSLRYQTDRFQDDLGLAEYEAGVSLPLWGWGARDATQSLGNAFQSESEAHGRVMRWQVAGEMRRVLWNVALAVNDFELVTLAVDTAERIAATVERSHELGEVARRDVLMAQSALLETRAMLIEARASLLDAEREYRSVSAQERRPAFQAEILSELHEVPEQHPVLEMMRAEVARAEARQAVVSETFSSSPHLLVGPRRERAPLAQEYDDSIGITMQVPFGGSSHRNVEVAEAARAVAAAQAALQQQQRALSLQLHEAAHGLEVANQNLAEAMERMQLADEQQQMGLIAYETGELDLIDLLRLQEMALSARRSLTRLQIDLKRQTALYNQAVGVLP
jgi:outer membrane protein TolC